MFYPLLFHPTIIFILEYLKINEWLNCLLQGASSVCLYTVKNTNLLIIALILHEHYTNDDHDY